MSQKEANNFDKEGAGKGWRDRERTKNYSKFLSWVHHALHFFTILVLLKIKILCKEQNLALTTFMLVIIFHVSKLGMLHFTH